MRLLLALTTGALAISFIGCNPGAPPNSEADNYLEDASAIKRGRLLFVGTCAGYCHKLTPERSDAPYLFDCEWKHGGTDNEIYATVTNGVTGTRMIAFGENFPEGAADLWKIIAFMKKNRRSCG